MKKELFNLKDFPYICTPLTGSNLQELLTELSTIVSKKPDLIEWRVDFFNEIQDVTQVLHVLKEIKENCSGIPLLFTIRSEREGGQPIPLSDTEVVELLSEICKGEYVDMIDYEVSNKQDDIKYLREVSSNYQKKLLLSYHNFDFTPDKTEMLKKFFLMDFYGADVAKVSVMPNSEEDVLLLLETTKEANKSLPIPVVGVSMGEIGAISRAVGWFYGSAITFAVGEKSSAPGQIAVESIQQIIGLLKGAQK